jgi:hypothetical protein
VFNFTAEQWRRVARGNTTASGSGDEQIDLSLSIFSGFRSVALTEFEILPIESACLSKQGTYRRVLMLCTLAGSVFWSDANLAEPISRPIALPIEIMGAEGSVATVTIKIPQASASQVSWLWLQIHGLEYPDLASFRVNGGAWVSLNNSTVTVLQPGLSYGGIGGAFATLKMIVPMASGSVLQGVNRIAFCFNRTNGVVSGFRVLAFNLLRADGERLLPPEAFLQEDPERWVALR